MIPIFMFVTSFARADDAWQDLHRAIDAGAHAEAAASAEALIASGVDGPHIWNALGYARYREGSLGGAVAAFRRAHALAPRDPDIAANLAHARADRVDDVAPPGPGPVAATLAFWHYGTSPAEAFWITFVAQIGAAAGWIGRRRRVARVVGVASAVVALCFFGSWSARQMAAPIAVIDVPEAPVRAGVGTDAVVRFRAHAGTEAVVTDERDGWIRVSLTDGNEGWLDARDVRRIP
jgi:hypothetical protein